MFRFSVLLAFIFAYLFGPAKATPTPLKKKSIRRRVRAPAPVMTNGLAALDGNQLLLRASSFHHGCTSDSSSGDDGHHHHGHHHRHHRKKRKRVSRHRRIQNCCRKCRQLLGELSSGSSTGSQRSPLTSESEANVPNPPMVAPNEPNNPAPGRQTTPVRSSTEEDTDSSVLVNPSSTIDISDSDHGHHSHHHHSDCHHHHHHHL